ncbi:hypothetical protein JOC85_003064 [Bacillus mesophilus]|uniref:Uncharacterized protein n=2 Tax=Bacillus mesophilus TaxID=1808955 RepID=A0A6M0Q9Q8_9BACI|nr:hypothetical protein [Bacillus mesophilus]MBM7662257.1 hypothetical protein [Bacillus mesophilus]NEY73106.1 hypothetical protein [Bacillus mesophilus]
MSKNDKIIPLFKQRIQIKNTDEFVEEIEATISYYKNRHEQSVTDKLVGFIDSLDDRERMKVLVELRERYYEGSPFGDDDIL